MPRNQFQRMVFAFITVVITVHAYVFYSLYVVNGNTLMEFNILTLLANWLKLICFNFPFACFTQLFFIQPLVRVIFKAIFRKDIEQRNQNAEPAIAENEQETIADIFRRIGEIQEEIAHEHRRRKKLEESVHSISAK